MCYLLVCPLPCQTELVTVNETGHTEISSCLNPKDTNLREDLTNAGSHGVDTNECSCTKGTGEEPRHTLPGSGNAGLRPRNTSQKEQGHRNKNHDQHNVLTVAY